MKLSNIYRPAAVALLALNTIACAYNPATKSVEVMSKEQASDFGRNTADKTKESISNTYNKLFGKTQEQQITAVAKKTGKTYEEIAAIDASCPEGQKVDTKNEGSVFSPVHVPVCVEGMHYKNN
ncbi:MAG: hypothetical protein ACPG05_02530 [Bdellovibrionales bacterium]